MSDDSSSREKWVSTSASIGGECLANRGAQIESAALSPRNPCHRCREMARSLPRLALRPAYHAHLPTPLPASTEESIAAVGLQPGHPNPFRHRELLEHFARRRIDAPHLALVALPGTVPQLSVHPRHTRDEPVRFDRAQDLPRLGVDLMDLPRPMLSDPQRPLGPRESGVAAIARRRDAREDPSTLRIDLVDLLLGDLEEMRPVERRPGVRGDLERAHRLPALRIERSHVVTCGEPHARSVVGHAADVLGALEWTVLSQHFG